MNSSITYFVFFLCKILLLLQLSNKKSQQKSSFGSNYFQNIVQSSIYTLIIYEIVQKTFLNFDNWLSNLQMFFVVVAVQHAACIHVFSFNT